jgi:Ser/Thr protein kinase RdoA (MazF antagonist)
LGRLFALDGPPVELRHLAGGHIHDTWLAGYRQPDGAVQRVVHQRLNASVFPDLAVLAGNLERVTAHLGARNRRSVALRPAASGGTMAWDAGGSPWRTLTYLEGTRSFHRFAVPEQAAAAAAVAAGLVADLADLPGPPLPEVIARFHDVVRRLDELAVAAAADAVGRAAGCRAELAGVLALAPLAHEMAGARADGRLPERTVHNDAKADNVLFDEESGDAVCLVDLDTVGPGTVLFDLGDLVRSGAPTDAEDGNLAHLGVRAGVVAAILDGYAAAGAAFLTEAELALFPQAGPLMTLESAARFLTDHLRGDVYFRIEEPGHNLRRARAQLRLFELLS